MSKCFAISLRRLAPTTLVALTALVLLAPTAASATTVTYNFTVTATDGPLNGATSRGTFSYNSSSITPGTANHALGLLTGLDFTWNGTTYGAATANTGLLGFGSNGQLAYFAFGTSCSTLGCSDVWGLDDWSAGTGLFNYTMSGTSGYWFGTVTFSPASTAVPEPSALGTFSLGVLLIGAFVGLRRRMA